jgi:hypothetical protein
MAMLERISRIAYKKVFCNLNKVLGKDLSLFERPALYQLVGAVTAHQGYDG